MLRIIRIILLVLVAAFVGVAIYRWTTMGFDARLVMPIVGLLFFYFVTAPKIPK